ncbi:MAG TPA: nucleoside monophosphate kinase [Candidatus Paceibacterota bacterium]
MSPQTFIFFGPSGAGKGTQAKLLMEKLKEKDSREILYIETGQRFRDFSTEASFTAKLTKEIMTNGGLLPEFLPIWIWTEYLIKHVSGDEHMVLDGLSRRAHEAPILDSAMRFYKREKPFVLSVEVSGEWAKERLLGRGRVDDSEKEIEERIAWYYENVVPAMEYFKNNPNYNFIPVNGEQTIEEVHNEIMSKIGI